MTDPVTGTLLVIILWYLALVALWFGVLTQSYRRTYR